MIYNNPFLGLSGFVSPIAMQVFVIAMVALVVIGTLLDIIHKKNVKYFFNNAKKAKKNAKIQLTTAQKTSVILKTVESDIATTSLSTTFNDFLIISMWPKVIGSKVPGYIPILLIKKYYYLS